MVGWTRCSMVSYSDVSAGARIIGNRQSVTRHLLEAPTAAGRNLRIDDRKDAMSLVIADLRKSQSYNRKFWKITPGLPHDARKRKSVRTGMRVKGANDLFTYCNW